MKNYYMKSLLERYGLSNVIKFATLIFVALKIIDDLDLPSKFISSTNIFIIAGIVIILLTVLHLDLKLFNALRIKVVNTSDIVVLCFSISLVIYGIVSAVTIVNYKVYFSIVFSLLLILILLIRAMYINRANKMSDNVGNVHDLKELCEGKIEKGKDIILIEDKAVDYDLLERNGVINNLYKTIVSCSPNGRFVIGLEGSWGSGKTTIIDNVKKILKGNNPEIQIIDSFDPWGYNDQASMFRGMFDTILSSSGFSYSVASTDSIIASYFNIFFDMNKYGKGIAALGIHKQFSDVDVKKTKKMINDFLRANNKRIVFIIDNIDRAEKENILLLFKIANAILDFNGVTYVLSYDSNRVKEILQKEQNIDYDYLKKIVQLEIKVPIIGKEVWKKIVETSIKSLLRNYGEEESNFIYYEPHITQIVNILSPDIRDLKRLLNSAISFYHGSNAFLNHIESLSIEFISFFNYNLYCTIYENRKHFISYDKELEYDWWNPFLSKKESEEELKEYYDSLFKDENNKKYKSLLALLFPQINKYLGNSRFKNTDSNYKSATIDKRICSAKYFDLYFTLNTNDFISISNTIEEILKSINVSDSYEKVWDILYSLMQIYNGWSQKYIFETLQFYLDKINSEGQMLLCKLLYDKVYEIDNYPLLFGTSAQARAITIISEILINADKNNYNIFIDGLNNNYDKLGIISHLHNLFSNNYNSLLEDKNERIRIFKKAYTSLGAKIYDENINLYSDDYYSKSNIWGLYHCLKDDTRNIQDYISSVLNEKSIIRFLFDVATLGQGSNYFYKINKENIDCFTNIERIDEILSKKQCYTDDERFVLSIYEKFREDEGDGFMSDASIAYDPSIEIKI